MMATFAELESPSMSELPPKEVIFGSSPAMGKIRQKFAKAEGAQIAVLLRENSGT
jgi:DNA-binding NtrC family response regulator